MVTIRIRAWNDEQAWANYHAREKRQLLYLLRLADPAAVGTARKRLASAIRHREPLNFQLPSEHTANAVVDFLVSIGADAAIDREEAG
jgi:hypothetical protein